MVRGWMARRRLKFLAEIAERRETLREKEEQVSPPPPYPFPYRAPYCSLPPRFCEVAARVCAA